MSTSISISEHPTLDDDQQRTVLEIVAAATRTDGSAPLDEHSLIALRHHDPAVGHVLAVRAGSTVGYAIVEHDSDGAQAEMVVHPDQRQLGIGTALLQALPTSVQIWAHGNIPAAQTIAAHEGFTAVRTLWQLHRPLTGFKTPQSPDGITIRGFRPGVDDERWLAINAAAFAHHPEQGSWSVKDLLDREHEPWFDPAGFLIAEVTAPQLGQLTAGDLAGFHWTKVHDGGTAEAVG
ncbi:MAG: mycothiol synthase [Antricoccus sp.]